MKMGWKFWLASAIIVVIVATITGAEIASCFGAMKNMLFWIMWLGSGLWISSTIFMLVVSIKEALRFEDGAAVSMLWTILFVLITAASIASNIYGWIAAPIINSIGWSIFLFILIYTHPVLRERRAKKVFEKFVRRLGEEKEARST
jgi:hypothetical protein